MLPKNSLRKMAACITDEEIRKIIGTKKKIIQRIKELKKGNRTYLVTSAEWKKTDW